MKRKKQILVLLFGFVFLFGIACFIKEHSFMENVNDHTETLFVYYVDDVETSEIPSFDSGYVLSNKSKCTNGITVSWDRENWIADVDFTHFVPISNVRTMCELHFEKYMHVMGNITTSSYSQNGKYSLSKVVFESTLKPHSDAEEVVDFSEAKDGSVMGYYVKSGTSYILYIQSNGKIKANANASYYFANYLFEGIENVDTSEVEDMSWMFYKNQNTTLDLRSFNTSKVTNMKNLFREMTNATNINVSGWDTSNVTDMGNMFFKSSNLVDLDLSSWNTSKVIDMGSMLQNMTSLQSINVNGWDTSNVIVMGYMFSGDSSLRQLDLSTWNTSNVLNMIQMFAGTSSIHTITYGENFIKASDASVTSMFLNSSAPKPTGSSWNGVF